MGVRAIEIASYLEKELNGEDRNVIKPCSLNKTIDGGLVFVKKYNENMLSQLLGHQNITAIVLPEYEGKLTNSYILSENPRLDFARVLQKFFVPVTKSFISPTAKIGENVILGGNVSIGAYSVIGNNVKIGDNTTIRNHVVIGENCIIGKNCLLKSHCVIGEEGLAFEKDENGVPVRIPHFGSVQIGDRVEVGSCTTIMQGTLDNTIIEDDVKIDDHTLVAHNVYIEQNCMITASAIGGSVRIKQGTFLTTGSVIRNGIIIGTNVLVGIGSVVQKDVENNTIISGNPAKAYFKIRNK